MYKLATYLITNKRRIDFLLKTQFLFLGVLCIFFHFLSTFAQGEEGALGFSKIAEGGFWQDPDTQLIYDQHNSYAWGMAWFKGKLYVGTNRDVLVMRYFGKLELPPFDPYPVTLPPSPYYPLDTRGQIWRYTPETGEWEMVYQSPWAETLESQKTIAREMGYRVMTVYTDKNGVEALYVGTFIATPTKEAPGVLILRTKTGNKDDFEIVSIPGLIPGLEPGDVTGIRTLVEFKGKLYTTPVAQHGTGNEAKIQIVYETDDPARGLIDPTVWRPVSRSAFGDDTNLSIFEMAVFNGYLYAGTLNYNGYQIWKTDGVERDPDNPELYKWTLVVTDGAYRGPLNEVVASMCSFKGADGKEYLYVGGGIQSGGHDTGYRDDDVDIGPGTAELIRIAPDDSWELICGDERVDPDDNPIVPITGLGAGFNDPFTAYFWRMAEHDGWLYVGTFDNSTLIPYIPLDELDSEELKKWLESYPGGPEEGAKYIVEQTGGFNLWKSPNGIHWCLIDWLGFGDPFNYGARSLISTPAGLAIGTANPFTDAPVLQGVPQGGAQVWLGIPGALPPPDNLQANFEANQVKLRWTPHEGDVRFNIIRFTSAPTRTYLGPPKLVGETTEHFFVDNSVESNTTYVYYVEAESDAGTSSPSNIVLGVTQDIFKVTPGNLTFNRASRKFLQTLTITNNTSLPLNAPVPLVLEGLTSNVTLANQTGVAKNGSPLIYMPGIPPGGSVQILLKFNNPTFARIKYIPFVVFGPQEEP